MIRTLRPLLLAALACAVTAASAQTMYRCGNAFQDHPCAGAQQGQVIGTTGGTAPAKASSAPGGLSAVCAQRGAAAQKIKWMREAGKTQQEQTAAATDRDQQDLVADVYRRQGTSVQVRADIEQDCMAEQERAAQANALLGAANKARGGSDAPAAAPVAAPAVAASSAAEINAANAAANKKATCQSLNSQLDSLRSAQRAGGDIHAMDSLRQQYTDVSSKRRAAGC